ncbi:MAG: signal peptidase II, partial [Pseudomonadota bacterium]
MRLVFWSGFWVFIADQATKYLVVHFLNLREVGSIDVFPPFINLRMAWNYGINFGLFADGDPNTKWILIGIAIMIIAFVLYWLRKEAFGRLGLISAGVLLGGAVGNIIDRLLYGAVADFLNMSCCGFDNPYSFNIADIAI